MKLFSLVKTFRGKAISVMIDSYKNCKDKMESLRDSQRKGVKGQVVNYRVEDAPEGASKTPFKPIGWYQ